ncbi:MAG: hypothetical protein A3E82_02625 [Gammaproteobacteria bacterium RIFCSPHIGHO2_12_FULL_38_11]|nr:MAG: hypothetical protein A3E82_02625 [Gammaproteobacteria bacterium RIFCSPHIGHO2_12_FULL_38_11]
MSNRFTGWLRRNAHHIESEAHVIVPRANHSISRAAISPNALKVLYRLKEEGYDALLVGGGVRDILLGRLPKDFDVATNAHPEKIRKIFRNSRIIGRRFRLVHVFFPDEIIEVSTFRANTTEDTDEVRSNQTKMIASDNTFGTIEEDAWRRDFTVNALYYNINDFSVVDYTQGLPDLSKKLIRIIGDPSQRYHEDPVRLLRALRFAAKLNFNLEEKTQSALLKLPHLLQHVPASRLFDEILKLFFDGNARVTYLKLQEYGYFHVLFPSVARIISAHNNKISEKFIALAMSTTDERFLSGQSVNPAFLLAVMLWPVLSNEFIHIKNKKTKFYSRLHHLIDEVILTQVKVIMIPKRMQFIMRDIWILQFYLEAQRPSRIESVFQHRYFRAAIDFMELRVQSGEIFPEKFNWWHTFQYAERNAQQKMIEELCMS